MATYPTISLQPGSTNTAAVKQLQDYLVSQGLMTQAQVNTGYGTYGPQTTASVLALQKKLGIDYSSGPGYFGPKTLAGLQGQVSAPLGTTAKTNELLGGQYFDPATGKQLKPFVPTPTTPAVSVSGLSTDTKPVIPPPVVDTTDFSAIDKGITAGLPKTEAQVNLETAQTETTSLLDKIKALFSQTEGKATEQAKLMESAGITAQQKDIQELTNQLNVIQAESQAQQMTAEGQPIAMGFITGQQAQIQRTNAIKSLTVSSQLQAKQGNLTLALDQIDTAIKLKYQPLEDELKNKVAQLELLDKYVLTPAETVRKAELAAQYSYQEEQVKAQKAAETIFNKNVLDAQQGGVSNLEVQQARQLFSLGNIDEANAILVPYLSATAKRDTGQQGSQLAQDKPMTSEQKKIAYDDIKQRTIKLFADGATEQEYQQMRQELKDGGLGSFLDEFDKFAQPLLPQKQLSLEEIKTEIIRVITPQKDILTRNEAETAAENQLSSALGLKTGQKLPGAYSSAIDEALEEVYGKPWWKFW